MEARFGVTEKERILRLAAGQDTDQDGDGLSTFAPESNKAALAAALQRGPEFLQAVPNKHRLIAPFINRNPKVGRALRQKLLDKLLGQHLAMAAATQQGSALSPEAASADEAMVERCKAAAVEQEADLYERCASSQVYANLASRTKATEWCSDVRAIHAAEKAYSELLEAQRLREAEARSAKRQRRSKDVEKTDEEGKGGNKSASVGPALLEADLDWGRAKPENDNDERQHRQQVVAALEALPGWGKLSAEERVVAADRCTEKVAQRGPAAAGPDEEGLKQLASKYVVYLLQKRKLTEQQ